MANVTPGKFNAQIVYFSEEGRRNLDEVLKVVQRLLKKREELRVCKIVFFTAFGEGPAKAYGKLSEFTPKIVAVTFPRSFVIKRGEDWYHPRISNSLLKFFAGVGIEVIVPPSLPFDTIEGMDGHNQEAQLVRDVLSIFGGGFSLCVQAVMLACDAGHVEVGDSVIAITGDVAALITASTTRSFLNKERGVSIDEIFCKPRKLTIVRPATKQTKPIDAESVTP